MKKQLYGILWMGLMPGMLWAALEQPVGWWALDEGSGDVVVDSMQGRDGIAVGNLDWIEGVWGNALAFDGINDYVDLPIGPLLNSMTDITVAVWVDFAQSGGAWQRIWDFGSGTTVNWFLTPSTGSGGPMRVAMTVGGYAQESQVTALGILETGWHHVAVTLEQATMAMRLIVDGEVVGEGTTHLLPRDLGSTTQNWLGRSQYGNDAYFRGALDDLRLFAEALSPEDIVAVMSDAAGPVLEEPIPADGSQEVPLDMVLRWPDDPSVVVYILYLGTVQHDVEVATPHDTRGVLVDYQIPDNHYALAKLAPRETYYWRVDSLVDGAPDIQRGEVWRFNTTTSFAIDDFESYTNDMDAGKAIFQTWVDGWGDPYNGAWVGHMESPYSERDIVYQGYQAMPLWYDNIDGFAWADMPWQDYWDWLNQLGYEEPNAIVSEATRTFTDAQDWIGTDTTYRYLLIHIRGETTNTGGPVYARLNDQVVWHPDPNVLTLPQWTPWIIDLHTVNTDFNAAQSLSIGVVGLGYGVLYVDEISLHQDLPLSDTSQDPGNVNLMLRYDMEAALLD